MQWKNLLQITVVEKTYIIIELENKVLERLMCK